MRYILNSEGYVYNISFGAAISCDLGTCTEYTGSIPEGYETIEEWFEKEIDNLNAWKIVDGNLVYDENRAKQLEVKCGIEAEENATATHKYVNDRLNQVNSVVVDELSSTEEGKSLIHLKDSGDYTINALKLPLSNEMYLKYKGAMKQETREGYQIVNFSKYDAISTLVTYTFENDIATIQSDGGVYKKVEWSIKELFLKNANGKITFDYDKYEVTGETSQYFQIEYMVGTTKKYLYRSNKYFTIPADLTDVTQAFFCIYVNNSNVAKQGSLIITKPRLYLGTGVKPYEQYGSMPSPEYESLVQTITGECKLYNVKRNLFDVNDLKEKANGVTKNSDDSITITFDNTAGTGIKYLNYYTKKTNRLKPNTQYYVIAEVLDVSGTGGLAITSVFGTQGQVKEHNGITFGTVKKGDIIVRTFTTVDDFSKATVMIRTFASFSAGQSGSITFRISVLEDKPNINNFKYTPFNSQEFPVSLGNIELCENDYIHNKNGKWYKHCNWYKQRLLNLTCTITAISTKKRFQKHLIPTSLGSDATSNKDNVSFINRYKLIKSAGTWNNIAGFTIGIDGNGNSVLNIYDENYSDLEEFENDENKLRTAYNTYLEENETYIVYPLAEPYDEEITDETLIAQLNTITNELKLDEETVHFYFQSENGLRVDVPMYIEEELQLKVTNDNLIKNTAVSQTIAGVDISIEEDRTIILNGTAEEDIELILNGSDTNTHMLFMIKANTNHYQNGLIDGVSLGLYNYDGADRAEVSNIGNGLINLDTNEVVTEVVLKITNGTTFSNGKIYPNLTISDDPKQYKENQENELIKVDLSNRIFNTGDSLKVKDNYVYFVSGEDEEKIQCINEPLKTFNPETYVMLNNYSNMNIDYFKDKYLTNTINQIRNDIDGISMVVEENLQSTETITNKNILHLPNAYSPSNLIELRIRGKMSLFYLGENSYLGEDTYLLDSYLIQDTAEELTENAVKYHLPLKYLLYYDANNCDEIVITPEKTEIIRRVGENEDGSLYILENEEIESYEGITIPAFDGDNYLYLEHFLTENLTLTATYEIKNNFNANYAKKSELKITEDSIKAEVSKKVGNDEIIAKINMAIQGIEPDENGNIPADIEKSIIEILANKILIKSDNFELSKEGILTALAGTIAGWEFTKKFLYKNFKDSNGANYQSGLRIPDEANVNSHFIYAGLNTDESLSPYDAALQITHGGFLKIKSLNVNGESGGLSISYDSGRNAFWFNSSRMVWYLDDEGNGTWFDMKRETTRQRFNLYDAPMLEVYDKVHNKDLMRIRKTDGSTCNADTYFNTNIRVMGNRQLDGVNNSIYVQGYEVQTTASDRRLKKRIKASTKKARDVIKNIGIYEFDWRKPRNHKRKHLDFGYIAQQAKNVLTSLVNHNREYDTYQMDTLNLSALHTKAFQEVFDELEEKDKIIKQQQKTIDFLVNKLDCKEELENYLKGENE